MTTPSRQPEDDGARIDRVMALLRARGGRATGPRRVILETMASGAEHRTAEELAEEIRTTHPAIHQATVYRNLERFEALGVVFHTHLGHGPAQWHLGESHHVHLTCKACGGVLEADLAVFDTVRAEVRARHGFDIDARHFAITGLCRSCGERGGAAPT